MATTLVSSPNAPTGQIVDTKTGYFTPGSLKWAQGITAAVNKSLNLLGQFVGNIAATAKIGNRTEGIGTTVQHIDNVGVVQAPGIVAATPTTQGAVVLPPAAANNHLGSASINASTDFDPSGSAATAQANAIAAASNAGNITSGTLTNAVIPPPGSVGVIGGVKAIAPAASHFITSIDTGGNPVTAQPNFTDLAGSASTAQVPALSAISGQITTAQLPASGLTVVIVTAQLTGPGSQGSMTFTNGILTAQTPAT